jgi:hypothetical protein
MPPRNGARPPAEQGLPLKGAARRAPVPNLHVEDFERARHMGDDAAA